MNYFKVKNLKEKSTYRCEQIHSDYLEFLGDVCLPVLLYPYMFKKNHRHFYCFAQKRKEYSA